MAHKQQHHTASTLDRLRKSIAGQGEFPAEPETPPPAKPKPGREALAGLHACLTASLRHIDAASAQQDNPAVADLLDDHAEELEKRLAEVEETHERLYPEQPPLGTDVDARLADLKQKGMESARRRYRRSAGGICERAADILRQLAHRWHVNAVYAGASAYHENQLRRLAGPDQGDSQDNSQDNLELKSLRDELASMKSLNVQIERGIRRALAGR